MAIPHKASSAWWSLLVAAAKRVPEAAWRKGSADVQFAFVGDAYSTAYRHLRVREGHAEFGEGMLAHADAWIDVDDRELDGWVRGRVMPELRVIGSVDAAAWALKTMLAFASAKNLVSVRSAP